MKRLFPALLYRQVHVNGRLIFAATDPDGGRELWVSDGTTRGTQRVQDIAPGSQDAAPADLTAVGDFILFSAGDDTNGRELWALPASWEPPEPPDPTPTSQPSLTPSPTPSPALTPSPGLGPSPTPQPSLTPSPTLPPRPLPTPRPPTPQPAAAPPVYLTLVLR